MAATTYAALPSDVILRICDFFDVNTALAWRAAETANVKLLRESPAWSHPQNRGHSACPDTSFHGFLYMRKMDKRWSDDKPERGSFSIEVFARVKSDGRTSLPKHIVLGRNNITIAQPGSQCTTFLLKRAFPVDTEQRTVYCMVADDLVVDALCGFSSTIFFYGQTGSGKTYTCLGADEENMDGVLPRTLRSILLTSDVTLRLKVLEIYCEKVKVLVPQQHLSNYQRDAVPLLQQVMRERSTRTTASNHRSSRSHAVFVLQLTMRRGLRTMESTIHVVDLAGAERQGLFSSSQAGVDQERELVREAGKINQSLTTLGRVISLLAQSPRPAHIPYRDSKLTILLRSSLGGNASLRFKSNESSGNGRVSFVLTLSPDEAHVRETTATLRFGERAKEVKVSGKGAAASKQTMDFITLRHKLYTLDLKIEELSRVWQSCGDGRHDGICRCDRCTRRIVRPEEPFHIPKYCSLLEQRAHVAELLEEAQHALIGNN